MSESPWDFALSEKMLPRRFANSRWSFVNGNRVKNSSIVDVFINEPNTSVISCKFSPSATWEIASDSGLARSGTDTADNGLFVGAPEYQHFFQKDMFPHFLPAFELASISQFGIWTWISDCSLLFIYTTSKKLKKSFKCFLLFFHPQNPITKSCQQNEAFIIQFLFFQTQTPK